VNPNGKVPAIVDGDVTVFDSKRDPALPRGEDGKFLPRARAGARTACCRG
jgi:GST-like protein